MDLPVSKADLLSWGVSEIIGQPELEKALDSGVKLRVKLGIDPTSSDIHLGRGVPLWKLRMFQELGHHIDLIIGDFTGQIGDTSDKDAERPMLSEEAVKAHAEHYFEQVWMILDPEKKDQVSIHYNSEWLSKLTFLDVARFADSFSVNEFTKRELIGKRLEAGKRVSLREFLYPLMQGYDSIAVEADVELGGTDQRFNLLAGRTMQEAMGKKPQAIMTNPLVAGTDGRKMSSSWGNVIRLLDTPEDKFGKTMAIRDELITEYLQFLPPWAQPWSAEAVKERLAAGENPREIKIELAQALVALYHGEEAAVQARENWVRLMSEHATPEEMSELSLANVEDRSVVGILVASGLAKSKTEARDLIAQNGVRFEGETVEDATKELSAGVLQKGKRGFVRLV